MTQLMFNELELRQLADAAFRDASNDVITAARQTETPIVVWERGSIREIPARGRGVDGPNVRRA